jgi:hypothetical protein
MSGEEGLGDLGIDVGANHPRRKRNNAEITSDISEDEISDVNDGAWEVDGSVFSRELATSNRCDCTYNFSSLYYVIVSLISSFLSCFQGGGGRRRS